MFTRFLFAAVATATLQLGCAVDSYVVVTVDSPLRVPTEIDAFEVRLYEPDGSGLFVPEERIGLVAGDSFPLDLLFVPADGVREGELTVASIGYLDSAVVAQTAVRASWKEGRVTRIPALELKGEP